MRRRRVALAVLCGSLALAALGPTGSGRVASAVPSREDPILGYADGARPDAPLAETALVPGLTPAAGLSLLDPPANPHPPVPVVRSAARSWPPVGPDGIARTTGTADVALTFDDGPGANTPQILAALRTYGIKATFCVIGVYVMANPGLLQAIVREGHTLCNHSWRHDLALGTHSPAAIREDLQRTNDEIHKVVPGVPVRYFRHPGGNFTPNAVSVARELGMISLGWAVDPWDWNLSAYPPGAAMIEHIVSVLIRTGPGAIVLSHDGGGDRSSTVTAYRILLPYLRDRYPLIDLPVSVGPPSG